VRCRGEEAQGRLPSPLLAPHLQRPPASPAPLPVFKRGCNLVALILTNSRMLGRSQYAVTLPFIKVGVGLAEWLGSRECPLGCLRSSPLQQGCVRCSCFLLGRLTDQLQTAPGTATNDPVAFAWVLTQRPWTGWGLQISRLSIWRRCTFGWVTLTIFADANCC